MAFPMRQPMMYTTHGFDVGGPWQGSVSTLIQQMQAAGFTSITVLLDSQVTSAQVNALRNAGIQVIGWTRFYEGITPSNIVARMNGLALDGLILNIEDSTDYTNAILALNNGAGAGLPKAAVVTETPFDTDGITRGQVLQSKGVSALQVEVFTEGGHYSAAGEISNMHNHSGYAAADIYANFGTFLNELPTTYTDTDGVGRNFSMYAADQGGIYGYPETSQWAAWGAWHGGPAPPSGPLPPPPSPTPPPPAPSAGNQIVITVANPPIVIH